MTHVATKAQLAKELGVARSTLHRWEQLPGWPQPSKKGWNIKSCHQFVEKNGLKTQSEMGEEKRLLIRAQRMLAELKLRQLEGELCEIEQVKQHIAITMNQWRQAIRQTVSLSDANAIMALCREFHESISPDSYEVTLKKPSK